MMTAPGPPPVATDQPPDCPPPRISLRNRAREYYRRLMETPGRIESVAGGFAIGVFFGFSPWHGLHLALTFAFCMLLRRSWAAGAMGAVTFNFVTALIIIPAELEVGRRVLGAGPIRLPPELKFNYEGLRQIFISGENIFLPYIVGSVIVGGAAAIISYFWVRASLTAYRKRVYLRRHHGPDA